MEITLSKPTEEFVHQQIAKGFGSASVVRGSFRHMTPQDLDAMLDHVRNGAGLQR